MNHRARKILRGAFKSLQKSQPLTNGPRTILKDIALKLFLFLGSPKVWLSLRLLVLKHVFK